MRIVRLAIVELSCSDHILPKDEDVKSMVLPVCMFEMYLKIQ